MEPRKQQELQHYDQLAKKWIKNRANDKWFTDAHGLQHNVYSSYHFLSDLLAKYCPQKRVLDFEDSTGIHSIEPVRLGASGVVGIDISRKSLAIARERAKRDGVAAKVNFLEMDCESLKFPDDSFDIVLDGSVFSSLNLNAALMEIARVLKPDGKLIGIETLGHNPVINLKRRLNIATGSRTIWAANHIFKMSDFKLAEKYFQTIQAKFFHLTVLSAVPFNNMPGLKHAIKLLDKLDEQILKLSLLKRYAFKTVFIFSKPKK